MRQLKKYAVLWAFCFIFSLTVYGQGNSLLWEISGNGLADTSYLYGTIHIRDSRVFALGDSTYYAIHHCSALMGELNLEDKSAIKQHAGAILMPRDSSLERLIGTLNYKLVKKYCKKHIGAYSLFLNKIKPVFISAIISEQLLPKGEKKPLDMYLQDYASSKGKQIGGIETFEEQLAVLSMMTLQEQADMLVEQIKNIDEEKILMEQMLQLYLSEDLDSLARFVAMDSSTTEAFDTAILDTRNVVMIERMIYYMKSQSCFFAVGAAHLAGDKGLIVLLRKEGYNVRPVKRHNTNE